VGNRELEDLVSVGEGPGAVACSAAVRKGGKGEKAGGDGDEPVGAGSKPSG